MSSQTPVSEPPGLLRVYQVLATVLGINLLIVIAGFLGKLLTEVGSWWHRNEGTFLIIDQVHGFLFLVLIVIVFILGSRLSWQPWFTISVILLACVPFVSFWAERRTTHRVHAALAVDPATGTSSP